MQISLTPDLSLFAVMVIFIMNYLVVRRFFLEPINRVLQERERETTTADTIYQEAMARLHEATAHVEAEIHAAKRDAVQVREGFRSEAGGHRAALVTKAQSEAQTIVAEAETVLRDEVTRARERMKTESESLARLAAERILGRAV